MIKDIIKVQEGHGYVIDVANEIATEYEYGPGVVTREKILPFRLTFLGPPNIRLQRAEAPGDTAIDKEDSKYRYYTFVGGQKL